MSTSVYTRKPATKPEGPYTEMIGTCKYGFAGEKVHAAIVKVYENGHVEGRPLCLSQRCISQKVKNVQAIQATKDNVTCQICKTFGCVK